MNKKQAGIIVTLLALIVCAGILAAKVNGPLELAQNDFTTISQGKNNTGAKSDGFVESKLQREKSDAQTLATFRSILDDKNVSQTEKTKVEKQLSAKATTIDHEQRIEASLKGQGFEEVICLIDEEKAHVIVKAKELSTQQRAKIKETVVSISKIQNVSIEPRQ